MNTKSIYFFCFGAALLGINAEFAIGDSLKIQWNENNHNYQRFDNPSIAWTSAKNRCASLGGHLVTITSAAEQQFIYDKLLVPETNFDGFAIGASDSTTEYNWQWITEEDKNGWTYSNWLDDKPRNNISRNYLYILNPNSGNRGRWIDGPDVVNNDYYIHNFGGYICEWSSNIYIDTSRLNDLNGNSYPEDAILFVNYKTDMHTVEIRDRKTRLKIGASLTFAKDSRLPKGIVTLRDTNNNGIQEIGVLDMNYSVNMPVVNIRDLNKGTGSYLKSIHFFRNGLHIPVSVSVEPDINGNGADEITVLATNKQTGKANSETRDSKTQQLIYANSY